MNNKNALKIVTDVSKLENIDCMEIDITDQKEAEKILKESKKMMELLKKENGAGLSAIQVGKKQQYMIFLNKDNKFYVAVNPKYYADNTKKKVMIERCLSYPDCSYAVKRWKRVRAIYYTITEEKEFKRVIIVLNGIHARIFQHETDHCHGKTIAMIGDEVE
jgi:peptide deformylase